MGLFGRKKSDDSTERAMKQAEKIAVGKRMTGKLMKGFMGANNVAQLGAAMDSATAAQNASMMRAQGHPTIEATVDVVGDTGQLINFDPVINVTATLVDGAQVQLRTLVSKLQIPRQGDRILLMQNTDLPGKYLYAGLRQ